MHNVDILAGVRKRQKTQKVNVFDDDSWMVTYFLVKLMSSNNRRWQKREKVIFYCLFHQLFIILQEITISCSNYILN